MCEVLMEMERLQWKSKSRGSRGCGLGAGPCEGIRASQPSCCLGLGDAFLLPKCGYFEHQRRVQLEGCAVALVLDLAKAFERVSLLVVWAWATHFCFPRKILRVLCGHFENQRRVQLEGCVAEQLHHGHLARVQVELFAFTYCSAGCVERSRENLSILEAEGFRG